MTIFNIILAVAIVCIIMPSVAEEGNEHVPV